MFSSSGRLVSLIPRCRSLMTLLDPEPSLTVPAETQVLMPRTKMLTSHAYGRLRDPRLLSVRPMPSSSYLASEDTLTITLGLRDLMQGASYAARM
eukprot:s5409_g1.t1